MPRQEHVLSVFVASPTDVAEERARLEEIVRDLNTEWSRHLGVRLELVRWETHAYPGLGEDAQAVVNDQIPDDYDIFVGMLWSRFGTPTGRAGSGTIEEFDRAKCRWEKDSSAVKIMFYFKDSPLPPSKMEPNQLSKINRFRESLGKEGALYWTFADDAVFEKLLRLHLSRQVQSWHKSIQTTITTPGAAPVNPPVANMPATDADELGLIDLAEIFTSRFAELNSITERLNNATTDVGEKISTRTEDMQALATRGGGKIDISAAKGVIEKAASDMDQFVSRVDAELPLFAESLNKGMDAFIAIVKLWSGTPPSSVDIEEARRAFDAMGLMNETLIGTERHMVAFRDTVRDMPPMATVLNKAKRNMVSILDRLIEQLKDGQRLSGEAQRLGNELLKR